MVPKVKTYKILRKAGSWNHNTIKKQYAKKYKVSLNKVYIDESPEIRKKGKLFTPIKINIYNF